MYLKIKFTRTKKSQEQQENLFFFSGDTIQVRAEIPKTSFGYCEPLPLHFSIDNPGQKSIKQINVKLSQYLKIQNAPKSAKKLYHLNDITTMQYNNPSLPHPRMSFTFHDIIIPSPHQNCQNFMPKMIPSMDAMNF